MTSRSVVLYGVLCVAWGASTSKGSGSLDIQEMIIG